MGLKAEVPENRKKLQKSIEALEQMKKKRKEAAD